MRRLDNIDLRLLRVFATIVDAGGFADAQIALNLSSSTLSTHLATLERKLGGTLCERGRGGFRLTSFGQSTYEAAKQLFSDIETFEFRVGNSRGQLVGRLRVGIVDGVVTNPKLGLQAAIGTFMAKAEGVFVELALGTPNELERAIAEGEHDVVVGPFSQKTPGVAYVPLHREAHGLYCGRQHPLFDLPSREITRTQIEEAKFSVRGYRHLEDLYRADHPRASASVIHMEAQAMIILSGQFIGFLPCHIGDHWAGQGEMRRLRPELYSFESLHFAALRRSGTNLPLVQGFVDELKRHADMIKMAQASD
ncbi:HTH-type transcriptional activator CmpR [Hartmannibacter diazotrophicus]|uniref:HTH-type transcriptional activator CmpR n=1 Tax=Hartmannibacter diazotrophicus TaxID=1482074 RepID=A0A2C9D9L0_9HYPH|nr:LysR family transcriptional regulator [Hartmannibacter diazotrophicus]SON56828.1 HTH-type transcriptional activator CmpR [Hartmannibacter diazotrophicus]